MFIGEIVIHQFAKLFIGFAVWLIVEAEPSLFLHSISLVIKICLRDVEAFHPVGFKENCEVKLIGGQRLKINCPLRVGRPVHLTAIVINQHEVFALADIF